MAPRDYRAVALFAVLAMAFAVACGDGSTKSQVPTGTAATSASRSTQLPITAVPAGTSLLAFVRGNDLWLASLDGTTVPPQPVTTGAFNVGYVGYVRKMTGESKLYYVVQPAETQSDPTGYRAEYVLYRLSLADGTAHEIVRYLARPLEPFNIPSNASVSPDSRYIAYTDEEGLALLDLTTGSTRRLLEDSPCEESNDCFSYHNPEWSPTGDRLRVTKFLYEGGVAVLVNPFEDPVVVVDTELGSFFNSWSQDGSRLCLSQGYYAYFGALFVYDVTTGKSVDATAKVDAPAPQPNLPRVNSRGCAWKHDGTLAVGYAPPDGDDAGRIAVLDTNLEVAGQSDPIAKLRDLVDWLPDESGVLFNQAGSAGVYRPGVGVSDLPFQADRILALIP